MDRRIRKIKGFTLVELMVAVAILSLMLLFAGAIFRMSIDSFRTAGANTEIMQKLRAITDQLNDDFGNLRKDGEIFIVWDADPNGIDDDNDGKAERYDRFDRIMFFADGDFQTYKEWPVLPVASEVLRGNIARICYTLANKPTANPQKPQKPKSQPAAERVLARTQHILTERPTLADPFDPNVYKSTLSDSELIKWCNNFEYDKTILDKWKKIDPVRKAKLLDFIAGRKIFANTYDSGGVTFNPKDPDSIHVLMCQGVSNFTVQSWYDREKRWIPEVDRNGDGVLTDSDFFTENSGPKIVIDTNDLPWLLYPYREYAFGNYYGGIHINNNYPMKELDEAHFNYIPGLGRALKFTFTLYDSKGIIKEGRTFTHIVYLDK
ncbi:MAG: type II secretion system protein [Candidatus Brocadiia bacterium]|nr:MAG: type II secretion system protein [Candidatus Brocadiia bacterium]